MDVRAVILEEHSKSQTDKIIIWVGTHQKRFDELVALFLGTEPVINQRAGWPLSYIASAHPWLVKKHLKKLIENLRQPNLHNAVKRHTLRFLQDVPIPEPIHGELMERCFAYLESVNEAVAVKTFALTILHHLSKQYPDILPEIKMIVEAQLPHQTAAFKARAKKIF